MFLNVISYCIKYVSEMLQKELVMEVSISDKTDEMLYIALYRSSTMFHRYISNTPSCQVSFLAFLLDRYAQ